MSSGFRHQASRSQVGPTSQWSYIEGIGLAPAGPRHPGRLQNNRRSPARTSASPTERYRSNRTLSHDLTAAHQSTQRQHDQPAQDQQGIEAISNTYTTEQLAPREAPAYLNPLQYMYQGFTQANTAAWENSTRRHPTQIKSENGTNDTGRLLSSIPDFDSRSNRSPLFVAAPSSGPLGRQPHTNNTDDQRPAQLSPTLDESLEEGFGSPGPQTPLFDPAPPTIATSAPPDRCECPVKLGCPARQDNLIDCRSLVLEKQWEEWQNDLAIGNAKVLQPNVEPEDEPFMSLDEVRKVIHLLDRIHSSQPRTLTIRSRFIELQNWILKAKTNSVTQTLLDQSSVLNRLRDFLSDDYAPTRLQKNVPVCLFEDLTFLYQKWNRGDFSVLARRGLHRVGFQRQFQIDPNWPHIQSADYFGHGHLTNGQTWRTRLEMRRDGAHAPLIAGIYGTARDGAKSIVMGYHDKLNLQFYADVDQGDIVYYMGTALKRKEDDTEATNIKDPRPHRAGMVHPSDRGLEPTPGTKALITSCRTKTPVRLFRSFGLADCVPLKPRDGYRYDGLYVAIGYQLLKQNRQIYRFKLKRMTTGQGPLRENIAPPKPMARKRPRDDDDK